jgi:acetylornithine deacetylase/succinyl-diaminopimelate desuccinylase-like protein
MNRIQELAKDGQVQAAMAGFREGADRVIDLAISIQQIPSPTFNESERANYVRQRFESLALADIHQDEQHNVFARLPAKSTAKARPVIISAHVDTVFPAETDLTTRRDGSLIYGPGLGDNSTGVAGLLTLAQTFREFDLSLPADLWFAANVCEEGLGDLRGMRTVVDRFGEYATYIVVEGGLFGQISHQGIAVRRFRVEVRADGGHSWGSFGNASAVHVLGHIIAAIDGLEVPTEPKTTYNVGIIEGGTSINTIAQSANSLVDLRSEDSDALAVLERKLEAIVAKAEEENDVSVTLTLIGDRPAGRIARDAPVVVWATDALQHVGRQPVEYMAGSTDANVPLSRGFSAVCIGLTESGNTHRLDEYIDPTHLPDGLSQLLLLTLAAAGY